MKRKLFFLCALLLALSAPAAFAQEAADESASAALPEASVLRYFAAALSVGISCLAGGMAVGRIGTAAMGAMSENADLSGKALPYAGLAEGICLWGFLVALLIMIL